MKEVSASIGRKFVVTRVVMDKLTIIRLCAVLWMKLNSHLDKTSKASVTLHTVKYTPYYISDLADK